MRLSDKSRTISEWKIGAGSEGPEVRLVIWFERRERTASDGRHVRGCRAENEVKLLELRTRVLRFGVCRGSGIVLRALYWR